MIKLISKNKDGFSVIEIIIAAAVMLTVVTFVIVALQFYIKLSSSIAQKNLATSLIEEGGEALQLMRDKGFATNIETLSLNTTYYLYWNGSVYSATTTPTIISGNYYRTFILEHVSRDLNDSIVTSGGDPDINTRKATLSVSTVAEGETLLSSEMLIHNSYEE